MIELKNINKSIIDGDSETEILHNVNAKIYDGEFTAIVGPSGSGKSTLLTIIAALQSPSSGEVLINGKSIHHLSSKQRSILRFKDIGFVLQGSNLVPYLTVQEQFDLKYMQSDKQYNQQRIQEMLKELSIEEIKNQYPDEISGGERQRVAIGLALLLHPKIILADEPTASLDSTKAYEVVSLLKEVSQKSNTCILMVTHDVRMLEYCDRVLEMTDGYLKEK